MKGWERRRKKCGKDRKGESGKGEGNVKKKKDAILSIEKTHWSAGLSVQKSHWSNNVALSQTAPQEHAFSLYRMYRFKTATRREYCFYF